MLAGLGRFAVWGACAGGLLCGGDLGDLHCSSLHCDFLLGVDCVAKFA